jgi:hypothetical protein
MVLTRIYLKKIRTNPLEIIVPFYLKMVEFGVHMN